CGTPLGFEAADGLALSVVALDRPQDFPPTIAYGSESKLPWCDAVPDLPAHHTLDDEEAVDYLRDLVTCQHPDRDTDRWPPEAKP
ncbi:MAG: hypothetical protein KC668_31285, partial [Myxococcales bacterium]|nr:hypothetical protein [Myxococcales bacterium]